MTIIKAGNTFVLEVRWRIQTPEHEEQEAIRGHRIRKMLESETALFGEPDIPEPIEDEEIYKPGCIDLSMVTVNAWEEHYRRSTAQICLEHENGALVWIEIETSFEDFRLRWLEFLATRQPDRVIQ